MTKDVFIRVKGIQNLGDRMSDEPLELITVGEYYYRNGSHYLRYEEIQEGFSEKTINYIKISPKGMEVRKKGISNVHMVFEKEKKNLSYYSTPFGDIQMGISAARLDMHEEEECIDAKVEYALEMNEEHVADCFLELEVRSKNIGGFSLF